MLWATKRFAVLAVATLFMMTGATAEAAKGVKKAGANGQRSVSGIVTSINATSTNSGTFELRTANSRKMVSGLNAVNGAGNAQGAGSAPISTFHVSSGTQFLQPNGNIIKTSAIHVGSHVRVESSGENAQTVHLLSTNHSRGNFHRYRANTYHPYGHSYGARPHRR